MIVFTRGFFTSLKHLSEMWADILKTENYSFPSVPGYL